MPDPHSTGLALNWLFWLRLGTLSLSQLETVATQQNLKARVRALQKTGCSERDVLTPTQPTHFQMCRQSAIESQKIEVRAFERRCLT